ncbi:hypothetical protein, partial [Paraburkholderia atlantica]|uniref:hypothetical protein n=1 Tax=Paraburkholderia atlantica TaxID=2654982 RepID=UPI001C85EB67
ACFGTLNISSFLPLGRVYTRPAGRRNFRGSSDNTAGYPTLVERYSHNLPRMLARLNVSAAMVDIPAGPFETVGGYRNGQIFEIAAAVERQA